MDFTATQYCKKSIGLWQVLCYLFHNSPKWKHFRSLSLGLAALLCLWRPSFGPRHGDPLEQECSLQWDCLRYFPCFMAFKYMVYRIWTVGLVFLGWSYKAVSIFLVLRSTPYVLSHSIDSWHWLISCDKARVPERFYPGKFDVWGNSHQIFHILIVMAVLAHFVGLRKAFNHAQSSGTCSWASNLQSLIQWLILA